MSSKACYAEGSSDIRLKLPEALCVSSKRCVKSLRLPVSVAVVKADPYDNMILECAVEARVDYVVSGDSHLLKLERFEDIPILSPAQFLDVLES